MASAKLLEGKVAAITGGLTGIGRVYIPLFQTLRCPVYLKDLRMQ